MFDEQGLQAAVADNPYQSALSFVYRPPPWVPALVVCCVLGAGFALHLAPLPPLLKFAFGLSLLVYLARYARRHIRLCRRPRPILHLTDTDQWFLYHGTDKIPLRLLPESLVHPRLVVLCFRSQGNSHGNQRHDFVFTRRNTDPEQFRLLRVRLRYPQ